MKKKILISVILAVLAGIALFGIVRCKKCGGQTSSGSEESVDSSVSADSEESPAEESESENTPKITLNQENVILFVGDEFTITAKAENVANPVFVWSADGADDIVSLTPDGNAVTVKAEKTGVTKLIASADIGGHTYFRSATVTVTEGTDIVLVVNNVGFDENGYHVDLSTLTTGNGESTSVTPQITAYKNNKVTAVGSVTWKSENESVAKIDGNSIASVSEGVTQVTGSCVVGDKTFSVVISVNVYRPVIELADKLVIETENLSSVTLTGDFKGISEGVTLNNEAVGAFDGQSNKITFDKEKLPKSAKNMGEDCDLIIETSLARYSVKADIYTKIISTKEDFDKMAETSKACGENASVWDGYFVLGNNISYNGLFENRVADYVALETAVGGSWYNGCLYGFKGVFDGKGYTIDGIEIGNGDKMAAVFGVLHVDGVIKNVSFTNAKVSANSSLVCGAGGGSVENVYMQFVSLGDGTQRYQPDGSINEHCSPFFCFKEPTPTATVSGCIIDVTRATVNRNASVKLAGVETISAKNVIVIGGDAELRKNANATATFGSIIEFYENSSAQMLYKRFDGGFWAVEKGVPVSQEVYETIRHNAVNFTSEPKILVTGTEYKFLLDNDYVKITTNSESVTVSGSTGKISASATGGETVTVTATSILDDTKTACFNFSISAVAPTNMTDLTDGEKSAFYDVTLDKVYLADFADEIESEALYFVSTDFAAVTFANVGEAAQTLLAVTENGFYKITCASVTKVIEKPEDLNYIRRDYTVSSYGNEGCYDGKLLGTFVMVNDIDCSGLSLGNTGNYWENSRGFGGIFDGRGNTIKNLTVGKNGLFGAIAYATIKNVKFENVELNAADNGSGAYVALLSSRAFNSTIENIYVSFKETVVNDSVYNTSGLLCYETTFDCTFSDIEIDLSGVSGVKYVAEEYYDADVPYLSVAKSVYKNITVYVGSEEDKDNLVFAYKKGDGNGEDDNVVGYPDTVVVKVKQV